MNQTIQILIEEQMKKEIRTILNRSYANTIEWILSYYDNCTFKAISIEQTEYKNLTAYLNRCCNNGELIRANRGSGSYASYTFSTDKMSQLINEVLA